MPQSRVHINSDLKPGGTKKQIAGVILQMTFCTGRVPLNNALCVAKKIFQKKLGIKNNH